MLTIFKKKPSIKLSLAWIFDHLQANWNSVVIANLVTKLNQTTTFETSYNVLCKARGLTARSDLKGCHFVLCFYILLKITSFFIV